MKNRISWKTVGCLAVDIVLFLVIGTIILLFLSMPLSLVLKGIGMEVDEATLPLLMLERVLMLVSFLGTAIWILRWRRLPLTELGLSLKGRGGDIGAGIGVALVLYMAGFGVSVLTGVVSVVNVCCAVYSLLLSLVLFLLVSVTEELMMRGFVLSRMLTAGLNRFVALFLSSALFSMMHLANPDFAVLPFVNILLAGCLLGASFLYTRNLCFPVALHWFWNWLQGPVLGYKVSGMSNEGSLLTLQLEGSDLLTGGEFGFEGSLFCTILLILAILAVVGYYERKKRRA